MGVNIVRKLRVLNSACVLLSNYDLDLRPLAFNLQQVTLAGSAGSWAYLINNWKRQIRRSSEIAARRRIAANDQKKFTKNYIFETLKKYYIF